LAHYGIAFRPTSWPRFISAADARGSRSRILESHPNDQTLDLALDSRTPGSPPRASVVFLRDQLASPAEQRFRRDDGGDPSEAATTKALRFSRQSTPLGMREPQAFLVELLAENAVLPLEMLDHLLLVAAEPYSQQRHEELQRQRCHRETPARPGSAEID
jgi:hypothetical protein